MSEDTKSMFAEMFGETDTEVNNKQDETKEVEKTIEVKSDDKIEVPLDGTATLSSREEEPKDDKEDNDEKDDGVDPKELEKAKKELGIGGAAFCDELLATCPDVFGKLKEQGKTLHGLFNFAYSYALDEYVKKNGRTNGGGYWNLAELAEKYLDPNVKEGFTIGEPKVKKTPIQKPSPEVKVTPSEVKKIAKKAAKAAKKQREKIEKETAKAKAKELSDAEKDERAKFLEKLQKMFD